MSTASTAFRHLEPLLEPSATAPPRRGVERTRPTAAPLPASALPSEVLPVSVVVPTLNEATVIGGVLRALPPVLEVVVVDDSTDATASRARSACPRARVLQGPARGKGAALRLGLTAATAPYVVAMDGDGSMDPGEIPALVALLQRGFDVVKGSRRACGGGSGDLTAVRRVGNRVLLGAYNTMFRERMSDLCYGFVGLRRERLEVLGLYADGFEIEAQILSHAALAGLRLAEAPSTEAPRLAGDSHLRTCRDGTRVLTALLRARLQPGRELWRARAVADHPRAAA